MYNLLYCDLEHGSQTIGSKKDIEGMFGFPELEPSTFKEFQSIVRQLYTPETVEETINIGGVKVKQSKKIEGEQKTLIKALLKDLDYMYEEANRDGDKAFTYGYSTPNHSSAFREQFDKLILKGFDKWWKDHTEEGKQIKELEEMQKHVKDAVYASATPKNLLNGLENVKESLNAEALLNGGAKPLLQELNEIVIDEKK